MLNYCQGGGYFYDHESVKQLERERGHLEYALVVGTGLAMAVIGVAVSRTADNILEMKLDSSLEVRDISYDQSSSHHLLSTLTPFCFPAPYSGLKLMITGTVASFSM